MRAQRKAARVAVVADKRTKGAQPGAVAYPLEADLDAWLAKGWRVQTAGTAEGAGTESGGTPVVSDT